jgi:hypothetical protein
MHGTMYSAYAFIWSSTKASQGVLQEVRCNCRVAVQTVAKNLALTSKPETKAGGAQNSQQGRRVLGSGSQLFTPQDHTPFPSSSSPSPSTGSHRLERIPSTPLSLVSRYPSYGPCLCRTETGVSSGAGAIFGSDAGVCRVHASVNPTSRRSPPPSDNPKEIRYSILDCSQDPVIGILFRRRQPNRTCRAHSFYETTRTGIPLDRPLYTGTNTTGSAG